MPIPAGFTRSGFAELRGEKNLGLRVSGDDWERAFPVVFQQTGQILGIFSKRPESEGFTGFSRIGQDAGMEKGAL
jgi:hypothetical protein